ncbi:MAG: Arginine exporter protein ArgO [Alphaproteobacteria bacterium MarineAlpha5_Bin9]|nr:MAG: Arginine exporter protein ArgO [Alphaproteobacteria bacterium MarineAlpha5_Bin9]
MINFFIIGFLTGLSLILAIGAQNIFVIEQGLKNKFVFLVCFICSFSDFLLIFIGIFIFNFFQNLFTPLIELSLNILLIFFLLYFIRKKWKENIEYINLNISKANQKFSEVIFKTLSFTFLNPHVYSDTVFILGNFSKSFLLNQKIFFGLGASLASLSFFFFLGYLSKFFSSYLNSINVWKKLNTIIIAFMFLITLLVVIETFNLIKDLI